jgi:hypothetical protein
MSKAIFSSWDSNTTHASCDGATELYEMSYPWRAGRTGCYIALLPHFSFLLALPSSAYTLQWRG